MLNTAQDGMKGRDANAATNINDDGRLGFSFTAVNGGCVQDNVTGLMWEVKTTDGGLRDWTKTYTNYSPADSGLRLRRHFSRNPTGRPSPPRERKIGDGYAFGRPEPSCVRHDTPLTWRAMTATNDSTPCRLPCVLSTPALARGLRQNPRLLRLLGGRRTRFAPSAPSMARLPMPVVL